MHGTDDSDDSDSSSSSSDNENGSCSNTSNGNDGNDASISGSIVRAVKRAGKSGPTATVKTLLGRGASPDARAAGQNGTTLLMIAAGNGNVALTIVLLAAGANVNATDDRGVTALMVAVDQPDTWREAKDRSVDRRLACINALLAAGADVNARDAAGWTALMFASQYNYYDAPYVRALLASSADVNAADAKGRTALMVAGRSPSALPCLLASGANVNAARLPNGTTSLMSAAHRGDYSSVSQLLKAGADVDATDMHGNTALMIGVRVRGRRDHDHDASYDRCRRGQMLACFLHAGADVNAANDEGHTPLMLAARHQPCFVEQLLDAGADVNAQANDGGTALMFLAEATWCIEGGQAYGLSPVLEAARLKEAAQAAETQMTATAAAWAEAKRETAALRAKYLAVKDLVRAALAVQTQAEQAYEEFRVAPARVDAAEREASMSSRMALNRAQDLALKPACFEERSAILRCRAIRTLICAGADVNARRDDECTALMLATSSHHEYAHCPAPSKSALAIPPYPPSKSSMSAASEALQLATEARTRSLYLAGWPTDTHRVMEPCDSIITALIDGGADVEATDEEGWPPLNIAAFLGHTTDVVILLARGADIKAVDDYKDTALHHAAREGHPCVVSTLLAAGADDRASNVFGDTPLREALLHGQVAVVTMLLVRALPLLPPP